MLFRLGQSWSLILHRNARHLPFDREGDFNGSISWRVLDGVGQVVGDNLADTISIGHHRSSRLRRHIETNAARRGHQALIQDSLTDNGNQIAGFHIQCYLVRLDTRDIQQVAHQSVL